MSSSTPIHGAMSACQLGRWPAYVVRDPPVGLHSSVTVLPELARRRWGSPVPSTRRRPGGREKTDERVGNLPPQLTSARRSCMEAGPQWRAEVGGGCDGPGDDRFEEEGTWARRAGRWRHGLDRRAKLASAPPPRSPWMAASILRHGWRLWW